MLATLFLKDILRSIHTFTDEALCLYDVVGLPSTGSWQDLKDHMRDAGDVCFSDVYKDGTGAVEYLRCVYMKYFLHLLTLTYLII